MIAPITLAAALLLCKPTQAVHLRSKEFGAEDQTLRQMLSGGNDMNQDTFDKLFVRPDGLNHLLLSDLNNLVSRVVKEFPEIVRLETIGTTWQQRPIQMLVLDARAYAAEQQRQAVSNKEALAQEEGEKKSESQTEEKTDGKKDNDDDLLLVQLEDGEAPGVLMTGAHHPRELITVQMVMFELLKLIQAGIVNQDSDTV